MLSREIKSDTTQRFFDGSNIAMLPGTKEEVSNLSNILGQIDFSFDVHLGHDATEAQVKSISNPKVLHIATHGYFLKDVETSAEDITMGIASDKISESPLLRSGLLFAGAKEAITTGGDGVLTAFEALNLNLYETELVVLSACETGLGEIKNGEGVYGLQRAFQIAGAKSILMSLWTVSDEATQQLMTSFYQNWKIEKQPVREAFLNAQKSLKEKFPQPYFWAAFKLVGD